MSGIVLIASYPKSGNTWTRIVFEKLRKGSAAPLTDLSKHLHGGPLRRTFDDFSPVNAAELSPEEIDDFFPDVYRRMTEETGETIIVKTHNAARRNRTGEWLYPPDVVTGVVYLTRHPFDVAVSSAHHLDETLVQAVDVMAQDGRPNVSLDHLPERIPQWFRSWSGNVTSWLDGPYRLAVARYEDLYASPVTEFARLANAAGFACDESQISDVVAAARFDRLQQEEREFGFRESPAPSRAFFRAGRPGTWEGVLDHDLQARIVADHGAVMERLGYGADGSVTSPWTIR